MTHEAAQPPRSMSDTKRFNSFRVMANLCRMTNVSQNSRSSKTQPPRQRMT